MKKREDNVREFCGENRELFALLCDYVNGNAERGYPFVYAVAGGEQGFCSAMTHAYRDRATSLSFVKSECSGGKISLVYRSVSESLEFETVIENESGSFCQRTTVTNTGDSPAVLTMLCNRLCFGGYGEKFDGEDYELGFCNQTWYNEGQWRFVRLSEVGVTDDGAAPPTGCFEINGLSSQTTSRYFPNLYLRDIKNDVCYYCECEPSGKWHMSVGLRRGWWTSDGEIILTCGSAEDRSLQFFHTLAPNESYASAECVYGVVRGGVEAALKRQYIARRHARDKILHIPPVVFNDYMNCLWGEPEEEKCLRLARTAKDCGAQVYMTDAGWFGDKKQGWSDGLGLWKHDSDRFDGGVIPFIKKINEIGLTAGVWFELECCASSVAEKLPRDWFVSYRGELFGNAARKFFDFRNASVREYLLGKIKPLADAGVRYIKNDYNDSYYACGEEGCYGLQENRQAFFSFIDELYNLYPNMIIENCASGAMRSDGGMLKYFALQSISDQDDYRLYPSIVKGSLLNALPEQLGIWCMPRPVHCSGRKTDADPVDIAVFGFVSALAGIPYLSGRIDLCEDEELKIIKNGIKLYKEQADFIRNSTPEFPLGIKKRIDYDALVLSDGNKRLLYVWRLDGDSRIEIPVGDVSRIEQLFPHISAETKLSGNKITVRLKNKYTAAIFKLNG